MLTLLIDNHDSYTFNLFQLLAEVNGREPLVVRNDEHPWEELAGWGFDNVVLSPGPGHPSRARDFGVCADALARAEVPVLGVCLGMQGLAVAAGGVVDEADEPMHGRASAIHHDATGIFAGLPQGFLAVRYHSLTVRTVPRGLRLTAWTRSGVPMGLADEARARYGVQFHPESVASEQGRALLSNFRDLTPRRRETGGTVPSVARDARKGTVPVTRRQARRVGVGPAPEDAFVALLADRPHAFWLDSSLPVPGLARWSLMGETGPPLTHRTGEDGDLLARLQTEIGGPPEQGADLGIPFTGGLVGYLGYELKAECGAAAGPRSPLPDAALLRAERVLAYDHAERAWHLVHTGAPEDAEAWFAATTAALAAVEPAAPPPRTSDAPPVPFTTTRDADAYARAVAQCQARIRAGESYEVCLTDELRAEVDVDALTLHRILRRSSPAPHAAYLRLGADLAIVSSSPERFLRVGRDRTVESRPIKGTAARGAGPLADASSAADLADSEKDRAENLMIADLVRNDLGRVCEIGSVEVPVLMAVEPYATVHHLVTTVRGRLRAEASVTDAIRACFPPGSMTGAPKLRTMEILDELEARPRGPYAGALGYLGWDGSADLSVVIRTAVVTPGAVTIGAGGAVVAQSDPRAEHAELQLKAAALQDAVAAAATCGPHLSPA